jgi:hypothetical protein
MVGFRGVGAWSSARHHRRHQVASCTGGSASWGTIGIAVVAFGGGVRWWCMVVHGAGEGTSMACAACMAFADGPHGLHGCS